MLKFQKLSLLRRHFICGDVCQNSFIRVHFHIRSHVFALDMVPYWEMFYCMLNRAHGYEVYTWNKE